METVSLFWITNLEPGEGENVVKSPIWMSTSCSPNSAKTKWKVELNPNFRDRDGTQHLSVWVRLVDSDQEIVPVAIAATVITGDASTDYMKGYALLPF